MKITLYTVSNCQFSKQEKDYLQSHNLTFEEKNLETNRDFLNEMLTLSNNFAGTPVTKIEKDDGTIAVLKGYTKEEFDKTLGSVQTPQPAAVAENTLNIPPPTPAKPTPPPISVPETEIKPQIPSPAPNENKLAEPVKPVQEPIPAAPVFETAAPTVEPVKEEKPLEPPTAVAENTLNIPPAQPVQEEKPAEKPTILTADTPVDNTPEVIPSAPTMPPTPPPASVPEVPNAAPQTPVEPPTTPPAAPPGPVTTDPVTATPNLGNLHIPDFKDQSAT